MSKYSYSRIKENHVLDLILNRNPSLIGKIFICHDEEGNETFQSKFYDGQWLSYPDLQLFEEDSQEVFVLVEVKGFQRFPTDLPFDDIKEILPIRKSQLESYLKIFKKEEVPVKIVFVIGDDDGFCDYEYYWEDLGKIFGMPKRELFWDKEGYNCTTYFFRAKDFRRDVENIL